MAEQSKRSYAAEREGATWRFVRPGDRVMMRGVVWDVLTRDVIAPNTIEFEIRNPAGEVKKGRPNLWDVVEYVNPAPELALALLTVRLGAETLADSRTVRDAAGVDVREWLCPDITEMSRKAREAHLLVFHDTFAGEHEGNLEELHARTGSVVNHAHRG